MYNYQFPKLCHLLNHQSLVSMKGLQSTHDASVNMLHTQGIDTCQVYKEKDASTILAHIRPKEVKCSFCGRIYKTTQKLKAHIRSHHLRSATYKCQVCNKGFGDPYALNQHKKSHEEGGKKYLCAVCGKGFVTKAKSMNIPKGISRKGFLVPTVQSLLLTRKPFKTI